MVEVAFSETYPGVQVHNSRNPVSHVSEAAFLRVFLQGSEQRGLNLSFESNVDISNLRPSSLRARPILPCLFSLSRSIRVDVAMLQQVRAWLRMRKLNDHR